MHNSTTRFSDRVADYVAHRPSYPRQAIEHIVAEYGLGPGAAVADIGSGTGIFTELLLPHARIVHAVEPNRDMQEAAAARLGGWASFRPRLGSAESTGLDDASLDCVLSAQAAHWFDLPRAKQEFLRIMRPQAWVVLLWNKRRPEGAFMRAYEELLRSIPGYAELSHDRLSAAVLRDFLGASYRLSRFDNSQSFDFAGLMGRFSSSSYTPPKDTPAFAALKESLGRLFEKYASGGRVSFDYSTEVHAGRLV